MNFYKKGIEMSNSVDAGNFLSTWAAINHTDPCTMHLMKWISFERNTVYLLLIILLVQMAQLRAILEILAAVQFGIFYLTNCNLSRNVLIVMFKTHKDWNFTRSFVWAWHSISHNKERTQTEKTNAIWNAATCILTWGCLRIVW